METKPPASARCDHPPAQPPPIRRGAPEIQFNEPFGDTALGQGLGCAAVILAICLGMGGCQMLVSRAAEEPEAEVHLPNATTEQRP